MTEIATLAAGCFWCTEAIFSSVKGVNSVKPGYAGGKIKNPSYKEVCTGTTGHAEVIRISFESDVVSFTEILEVFFKTHDPTTLNRQGNDIGTQYRSAIFYHSEAQKETAENIIATLDSAKSFPSKIVTEVTEVNNYYDAENYHEAYYERNKEQPYCQLVINPKIEKFKEVFSHLKK